MAPKIAKRSRVTFRPPAAVAHWLSSESERTGETVSEIVVRILFGAAEEGVCDGYKDRLQGAIDRGEIPEPVGMKAEKK